MFPKLTDLEPCVDLIQLAFGKLTPIGVEGAASPDSKVFVEEGQKVNTGDNLLVIS